MRKAEEPKPEPKRSYQEREVDPKLVRVRADEKLRELVDSMQADEKLYKFEESVVYGPRAGKGRSGYFVLEPSGDKRYVITVSWIS